MIIGVAKELRKLCNEPLDGIKVMLNEEEVTDVSAEIVGPGAPSHEPDHDLLTSNRTHACAFWSESTPFDGGVFKIKLVLPSDYPQAPPKGVRPTKPGVCGE